MISNIITCQFCTNMYASIISIVAISSMSYFRTSSISHSSDIWNIQTNTMVEVAAIGHVRLEKRQC